MSSQTKTNVGGRNHDYPDSTSGSVIARRVRSKANTLSEAERERLFNMGMQIVYGGSGQKERVRTGC